MQIKSFIFAVIPVTPFTFIRCWL